jgi:hypothetical protein
MPRSAAQRAASAKFFAKHRPGTDLCGISEVKTVPDLVGKHLLFEPLRLVLRYEYSFRSKIDGEVYCVGSLVAQGPGTQFALGSEWSCLGRKLRIVDEPAMEERRAPDRQETRRNTDEQSCPWLADSRRGDGRLLGGG